MSLTDLATLALQLVGIYAIVLSSRLVTGPLELFAYAARADFWRMFISTAPYFPYLVCGVVLLVYARRIAHRLVTGHRLPAESEIVRVGSRKLQAVAFSIVGVVLIAWAVPTVIRIIIFCFFTPTLRGEEEGQRWRSAVPWMVEAAVQGGIGLWLFFSAKRLAARWHGMRYARSTQEEPL